MSMMSVRLPKELERVVPRKDRSSWVIDAIRQRVRRERIEELARDAAAHAAEDLEILSDWEAASAPLPRTKKRKGK